MSKWPMRGHFRYLRFKNFSMTPRTPQCEVLWALLSSSEHSGVPEDSKSSLFPSVGLHPHTWPKQGCDNKYRLFAHCQSFFFLKGLNHISSICMGSSFGEITRVWVAQSAKVFFVGDGSQHISCRCSKICYHIKQLVQWLDLILKGLAS